MNAVKFLLKEHTKFKKIFAKIGANNTEIEIKRKLNPRSRMRLFEQLCKELVVHEKMEETVWYPVLKKELRISTLIKHLVKEEKAAAKKIKSFKSVKPEIWENKVEELCNAVLHHATQEEEKLFPRVVENIDKKKLDILGKKLKSFRDKHLKKKTVSSKGNY